MLLTLNNRKVVPIVNEHPAWLSSLLLLAAGHEFGLTGRSDWIRGPTFLHHKAEVIRLLKEQILLKPTALESWCPLVVFILIMMEVGVPN